MLLVEFSNRKCGAVLVADSHKQLVGIFTDGDLRRALQATGSSVLDQDMSSLMRLLLAFYLPIPWHGMPCFLCKKILLSGSLFCLSSIMVRSLEYLGCMMLSKQD
jgi:hypothetical protein